MRRKRTAAQKAAAKKAREREWQRLRNEIKLKEARALAQRREDADIKAYYDKKRREVLKKKKERENLSAEDRKRYELIAQLAKARRQANPKREPIDTTPMPKIQGVSRKTWDRTTKYREWDRMGAPFPSVEVPLEDIGEPDVVPWGEILVPEDPERPKYKKRRRKTTAARQPQLTLQ